MAKVYFTDGSEQEVFPDNGTDFKLNELQAFVGGFIEVVYLMNRDIMVVNEEGALLNLPFNRKASEMAGIPVVGDVLVCNSEMVR